ncbi:MAG TPA: prolipoprotein diacylglyceryl transferase [Smithella sp.]|nr:prolipoprotein diacylglyceryl transferase [Smithella sp.]OQC53078.1 MAG: Prolipoprotein diacylglyceryl transferase [Deltaproteobacteria bacterium ADurb.Bin022]HNQ66076.1 prolipoprotein diacylglyceryl transferase [Smithella sp.]HOG10792.1 prolipoprotein diacylglyceryl transferase [Smithella sp.]HOO36144.1 prolipoprotein diacylglyceryl transferase [Smithella sp.]
MLPDIKTVELFRIGVLHISPFGVLAATGILTGRALALHRAKQAGIPEEDMDDALLYTLLSAFFFAHIAEAVFYHPDQIMRQGPVYLLKFWKGLSSFGGFFGGLFGFMFFVYRRKIRSPLLFAECILQGLVLGWIFGRLGCTIIFDHPGQLSDFFLAFQQPGGARHNLGFYEFLLTLLVLFPVTLVLHRLQARPGSYTAAVLILYTPVRFFLDFLRLDAAQNGDIRYGALTPGQYGSMILFVLGVAIAYRLMTSLPLPSGIVQPVKKKKKKNKER